MNQPPWALPLAFALALGTPAAPAQERPAPAALLAAQREAMQALKAMDGVWRGPAWSLMPSGEKHHIIQTERIGPMLDGSIKVINGMGYEPDGRNTFGALGTLFYDVRSASYTLNAIAHGQSGSFAFKPTPDGYTWEIPVGPATIRYSAVIKDGRLREVGDRLVAGQPPLRIFEMDLTRIGDTDWPAGGAVAPK